MAQQMSWEKVKKYNQTRSNPWYIKHTIGKIEKYIPMYEQTKWEDLTEEERYYALEQWYAPIKFPEFGTLEEARQYIKCQIEKEVHADVRAELMFESDACGMMNSCTGYYWYS